MFQISLKDALTKLITKTVENPRVISKQLQRKTQKRNIFLGEPKRTDETPEKGEGEKKPAEKPVEKPAKRPCDGPRVTLQLKSDAFKLYAMDEAPPLSVELNKCQAAEYLHQMQTIRRFENAAGSLYKEKTIRGFCHLYSGQEAICVGMRAAMRPQDNCITAYRCHGWAIVMGIPSEAVMCELTGRRTGIQRGKGGSMHMYNKHFFGGNGIVGAQVPLGAGIAFASQYKGDGGVCVDCYGDGAANQGQVFEAYNIACLWKTPVIFVCENNKYGMGTSAQRSSCCTEYYTRGDYIPGIWVDAMDILAVRTATEFAIEYVLANGPIVMEMHTYRYSGHSMSDPGVSYRTRDEIKEVRETRDPITNFKNLCLANNLLNEADMKAIEDRVKKEIDEVLNKAKNETEVELKELTADIYAANLEPMVRGINSYNLPHINVGKPFNI